MAGDNPCPHPGAFFREDHTLGTTIGAVGSAADHAGTLKLIDDASDGALGQEKTLAEEGQALSAIAAQIAHQTEM